MFRRLGSLGAIESGWQAVDKIEAGSGKHATAMVKPDEIPRKGSYRALLSWRPFELCVFPSRSGHQSLSVVSYAIARTLSNHHVRWCTVCAGIATLIMA